MQAISDAEGPTQGRTLDRFVLTKPLGWRPTKAGSSGSGAGVAAASLADA
jgi:hypothetical protein